MSRSYDALVVDDLRRNVLGVVVTGTTGVHHSCLATTVAELEVLTGVLLRH